MAAASAAGSAVRGLALTNLSPHQVHFLRSQQRAASASLASQSRLAAGKASEKASAVSRLELIARISCHPSARPCPASSVVEAALSAAADSAALQSPSPFLSGAAVRVQHLAASSAFSRAARLGLGPEKLRASRKMTGGARAEAVAQPGFVEQVEVEKAGARAGEEGGGQEQQLGGGSSSSRGQLTLEQLNWDNSFVSELPGDENEENYVRIVRNACFSLASPSLKLNDPKLVVASDEVAALLDLDPAEFERPEFASVFAGGLILKGSVPYAQCYGGHQFGQWAGQLGDGRAITIGEVVNQKGERWELQLKGAGKTPYSRHADGRAVLRSSVREMVASEAMHALGIPTTRALSLVTTGEKILRDMFYNGNAKYEPGAVVCRVAPSFLRFGSFQLHASRGGVEKEMVRLLANYAIKHHFPHLKDLPEPDAIEVKAEEEGGEEDDDDAAAKVDRTANKFTAWFAEVAERTGRLFAAWQGVGFTHGVLNTDNMSILGLTIDYGPYGFLDAFDPKYTPNTTDLPGRRYCFENQPSIGLWNIVQLANTLVTAGIMSIPEAQFCVSRYAESFQAAYATTMAAKLGMEDYDEELTQAMFRLMAADKVDFTNFFRSLGNVSAEPSIVDDDLLQPLWVVLNADKMEEGRKQAWVQWLRKYTSKLPADQSDDVKRKEAMDKVNPKYIPRNYLCQIAIEAAERGNFDEVQRLLQVLRRPFDEQEGAEEYAKPPPDWANKPGVCMLSCSS